MRNFIVTIDGKSYSVGVEEVGTSENTDKRQTPVVAQAQSSAPKISAEGQKILSPFPGLIKNLLVSDGAVVKKGPADYGLGSYENGQ